MAVVTIYQVKDITPGEVGSADDFVCNEILREFPTEAEAATFAETWLEEGKCADIRIEMYRRVE